MGVGCGWVNLLYPVRIVLTNIASVRREVSLNTAQYDITSLYCALASCGAVYCNRSCLWVCDSGRAGAAGDDDDDDEDDDRRRKTVEVRDVL